MKKLSWWIALVYTMTSLQVGASPEEGAVEPAQILKESGLLALSGQSLQKMADVLKPIVSEIDYKKISAVATLHPQFKIPSFTATKLDEKNGVSIVRLVLQYKSDTMTMDFTSDHNKPVIINGVVFTGDDLRSIDHIGNQFQEKGLKFKEKFADNEGIAAFLQIMNQLAQSFQSNAYAEEATKPKDDYDFSNCNPRVVTSCPKNKNMDEGSSLPNWCWWTLRSKCDNFNAQVADYAKEHEVSQEDLWKIQKNLKARTLSCIDQRSPVCEEDKARLAAITPLLTTPDPAPAPAPVAAKRKDKKDKGFIDDTETFLSDNWKPIAIVGGLLALFFGIRAINRHNSSSSNNNSVPGITPPTGPLYPGTIGTQ